MRATEPYLEKHAGLFEPPASIFTSRGRVGLGAKQVGLSLLNIPTHSITFNHRDWVPMGEQTEMLRFIFCEKYECTVCIEQPDCCFIGDKTEIPYPPTHKWRLLPHCWGSGTHNSSSWYSHWCWIFKSSSISEPLIGILKRWDDNDVGELVESGVEAGALSLSLSYYRVTVAQRSATAIRKCHNKTLLTHL